MAKWILTAESYGAFRHTTLQEVQRYAEQLGGAK